MSVTVRRLTPEQRTKLLAALRGGNYLDIAAMYAGVDAVKLKLALETARAGRGPRWLRTLRAEIDDAEQGAEVRALRLIMAKARRDPRHAAWWLERKAPARWGKIDRMELTGKDGGPVQLSLLEVLKAAHAKRRGAATD